MYPLLSRFISSSAPTSALILENFGFAEPVHAIHSRELILHGLPVTASKTAHGSYHSILTGDVWQADHAVKVHCLRAVSDLLREYITHAGICLQNCRTLVCGLGNGDITSDALGTAVCRRIPAMTNSRISGTELYVFCPGVPAKTGIPADTLVKTVAERMQADLLITVDALCARSLSRLAAVIQITDVGVIPGSATEDVTESGEISTRTMPCPVLTIGVPTVISSHALIRDTSGKDSEAEYGPSMPVSHTAIDTIIHGYSEILAGAINRTLLSPMAE